jgi:hypothetical protein
VSLARRHRHPRYRVPLVRCMGPIHLIR